MRPIFTALASAALVSVFCLAPAQKSVAFTRDGRPDRLFRPVTGLNEDDAHFVREAADINKFELEAANIAQQKGTTEFVKEFSKEMIANHTQDRSQIDELARDKGVTLSSNLPYEMQRSINYLSSLSGNDFDAAYRRLMIESHQNAAVYFEKEISYGHDQDVRAYAVMVCPELVLSEHLAKVEKTMMGPTKETHGI